MLVRAFVLCVSVQTIHPVLFVTMATIRNSGWFFRFRPYQTRLNLGCQILLAEYQARFTHKCFRASSEHIISPPRIPLCRQRSSRLILICLPSKGQVSLRPRRRSLEKESARYLILARKPRNTIPPKMRVGRRRYAN